MTAQPFCRFGNSAGSVVTSSDMTPQPEPMTTITATGPAGWPELLELWDDWQRAARRPATTRTLRRWQLRRLARDHPHPAGVTTTELARWLGRQPWSAETMRSYRQTLRSFYRWATGVGVLAVDPAAGLPPIRPPRHHARPCPDAVWRPAAATAEPRVQLAILLAARQGLRRGEVARAHSSDLRAGPAGWSLLVHGKGERSRLLPLADDIAGRLRRAPSGWLFPSPWRAGQHLTPSHVGRLVTRQLGSDWTMHTLRHRFATTTYAATRDLAAVQYLLGHSKPETTRNYVDIGADVLRAAVDAAQ